MHGLKDETSSFDIAGAEPRPRMYWSWIHFWVFICQLCEHQHPIAGTLSKDSHDSFSNDERWKLKTRWVPVRSRTLVEFQFVCSPDYTELTRIHSSLVVEAHRHWGSRQRWCGDESGSMALKLTIAASILDTSQPNKPGNNILLVNVTNPYLSLISYHDFISA